MTWRSDDTIRVWRDVPSCPSAGEWTISNIGGVSHTLVDAHVALVLIPFFN